MEVHRDRLARYGQVVQQALDVVLGPLLGVLHLCAHLGRAAHSIAERLAKLPGKQLGGIPVQAEGLEAADDVGHQELLGVRDIAEGLVEVQVVGLLDLVQTRIIGNHEAVDLEVKTLHQVPEGL